MVTLTWTLVTKLTDRNGRRQQEERKPHGRKIDFHSNCSFFIDFHSISLIRNNRLQLQRTNSAVWVSCRFPLLDANPSTLKTITEKGVLRLTANLTELLREKGMGLMGTTWESWNVLLGDMFMGCTCLICGDRGVSTRRPSAAPTLAQHFLVFMYSRVYLDEITSLLLWLRNESTKWNKMKED